MKEKVLQQKIILEMGGGARNATKIITCVRPHARDLLGWKVKDHLVEGLRVDADRQRERDSERT